MSPGAAIAAAARPGQAERVEMCTKHVVVDQIAGKNCSSHPALRLICRLNGQA